MGRLSGFLSGIDRASERIGRLLAWAMPLLVLVIAFEVAARYLFAAPTIWAYDSALLLYAWVGMLGGALALKRGAHIRVDLFTSRLSARGRAAMEILTAPLIVFFLGLVIWQVGMAALDAWNTGSRRPTEWAPPLFLFLVTAPLGAALILLQLAAQLARAVETLAGGKSDT